MLFTIALLPAVIGRSLCAGLPLDVRARALVLFVLAAISTAFSPVDAGLPGGLWSAMHTLVIVLAASLTWRLPTRLRTWGMELWEGSLLLLALSLVAFPEGVRDVGFLLLVGAASVWALVGVTVGLRGHGFEPRPITSLALGSAVVVAMTLTGIPNTDTTVGLEIAPVAASVLVVVALLPETRPDPRSTCIHLVRGLVVATVIVVSMGQAGLALDHRVLLVALLGALVVGDWRPVAGAGAKGRDATATSDHLPLERETLVVLDRLADPYASPDPGEPGVLQHVFPGVSMELMANSEVFADAPAHGPALDKSLMAELCRQGMLRSDSSDDLPGRIKVALRRLGRDVLLLPVVYDSTIYGALVVRGLPTHDGALTQLRRFADLLGHRLEAQRLNAALKSRQRLADLGTFATAMVHDLRSPLAGVRLQVQLLERSATSRQREAFGIIMRALDRVLSDLSGTLDFARPLDLNVGEFSLDELLTEVAESYQAQAVGQGVGLTLEPTGEVELCGDRARLLRVFENLVRNALDATPEGSVVRMRADLEGDGVTVVVEDRGPGIDPKLRERIFEPFVTTKTEGVGLGLAIVRRIVECHHGRISVRAPAEGGTSMQVWLPLSERSTEHRP